MAAFIFNIAKGKIADYASLPEASDALIAVLLSAAEAEDTLNNYDDLSTLLAAAGNTEAAFTGYSRQTLTNVAVTVDDTNNRVDIDCDNPQWSPTSAEALVRILICYDNDTGAGTDANIVPIFADDFSITTPTSGTVTYNVATGGFARAA